MEAWAGVELNNGQSYGVRVYQNGSTLVNHIDRSETHVISAIVHIDHDLAEPRVHAAPQNRRRRTRRLSSRTVSGATRTQGVCDAGGLWRSRTTTGSGTR